MALCPALQRPTQELDVDERLPGPRHTLQEERRRRRLFEGGDQRVDRRALGGRGRVERRRPHGRVREGITQNLLVLDGHQPFRLELGDHPPAEAVLPGQVRQLDGAARRLQQLVGLALTSGAAEELVALGEGAQLARDPHHPTRAHRRIRTAAPPRARGCRVPPTPGSRARSSPSRASERASARAAAPPETRAPPPAGAPAASGRRARSRRARRNPGTRPRARPGARRAGRCPAAPRSSPPSSDRGPGRPA